VDGAPAAWTILGCGNLNRSDDGVGVVVARRVAERLSADERSRIAVFDAGTDGMAVLYRARHSASLIVVDASRTGAVPGAIHVVPGREVEAVPPSGLGLHAFRWDHALYAGRRIFGDDAPEAVVYLVEAADLSLGLELSPAVQEAATRVVELVLERVREDSPR
jgi:hydrogenase maturation protease